MSNSSSLYVSVEKNLIMGTSMLSFELSAVDLILVIAVIVLLILYLTKVSAKPKADERPLADKESPQEERMANVTEVKAEQETRFSFPSPRDSANCSHHFGYLKKHDRSKAVPDECLGCSSIVECLSAGEENVRT